MSGEVPSVDAKLTTPDVNVEGGDVDLSAELAAGAAAAVGAIGAGIGLSGKADVPAAEVDVDAALPSVSGDVDVDVPSVEVKKPKKGMFSGIGRTFKKSYSKGKIEVNNRFHMHI